MTHLRRTKNTEMHIAFWQNEKPKSYFLPAHLSTFLCPPLANNHNKRVCFGSSSNIARHETIPLKCGFSAACENMIHEEIPSPLSNYSLDSKDEQDRRFDYQKTGFEDTQQIEKIESNEEGLTITFGIVPGISSRKNTRAQRKGQNPKHVGLGTASGVVNSIRQQQTTTEEVESIARARAEKRPWLLSLVTAYASIKVFALKLVTVDSFLSCLLSVGLTAWIYYSVAQKNQDSWHGQMDWVLLGFAVITPISVAISIAFARRERALIEIANFRSFSFQLYLIHTLWDWDVAPKGRSAASVNWLDHGDKVLSNLIGIGDELFRFLTLPTCSRSRHRVTIMGRKEAARTVEAAYRLLDSCVTRRFIRLTQLGEDLKSLGFPAGESSRLRQYERFMNVSIELLRMLKMYRSPQALRAFARIFSVIVPPLYSPYFAQLAINVHSLAFGVIFAILTSLALTALAETVENLEDPFVGYLTLDGISKLHESFGTQQIVLMPDSDNRLMLLIRC